MMEERDGGERRWRVVAVERWSSTVFGASATVVHENRLVSSLIVNVNSSKR
jgi:hypothetical protein